MGRVSQRSNYQFSTNIPRCRLQPRFGHGLGARSDWHTDRCDGACLARIALAVRRRPFKPSNTRQVGCRFRARCGCADGSRSVRDGSRQTARKFDLGPRARRFWLTNLYCRRRPVLWPGSSCIGRTGAFSTVCRNNVVQPTRRLSFAISTSGQKGSETGR